MRGQGIVILPKTVRMGRSCSPLPGWGCPQAAQWRYGSRHSATCRSTTTRWISRKMVLPSATVRPSVSSLSSVRCREAISCTCSCPLSAMATRRICRFMPPPPGQWPATSDGFRGGRSAAVEIPDTPTLAPPPAGVLGDRRALGGLPRHPASPRSLRPFCPTLRTETRGGDGPAGANTLRRRPHILRPARQLFHPRRPAERADPEAESPPAEYPPASGL